MDAEVSAWVLSFFQCIDNSAKEINLLSITYLSGLGTLDLLRPVLICATSEHLCNM